MVIALMLAGMIPVVAASVNLLALGDWGGDENFPYTTPGQVAAANGMGVVGDKIKAQAVIALGDNFYHSGIDTDETDDRFKQTWDSVYTANSLQVPWYVTSGNHDYKGNVTAQVAYTNDNKRWVYPDLYQTVTFTGLDGTTVDLVLIDTVDLSGESLTLDEKDPNYFKPLPPRERSVRSEEWDWIEEKMSASTADYLLVGGHYPVYSVCDHGNTQNLIDNLKPLLEQHGAHYLAGHDHCMEAMSYNNVQYILTGMGHDCCYDASNKDSVPEDSLKWYMARDNRRAIGGFTSITADKSSLSFTFYDQSGRELYTTPAVSPRSPQ
eukprot:CAMPEP_0174991380 /NCGR_PEP_ID=MMETSP0004_2-20121128/21859_1 /TAXON_ID=420556 /ORGANISM="Ochromonas sp., Strain CCMP1393" /LENGTH=322 /DNA_ID=CAMNT_0016245121 /DNA_START=81 /DNA_END=1049 /DNA_ORIENTATION=-